MNSTPSLSTLSLQDFRTALTPSVLQQMMILQAALPSGALLFAGVVAFLGSTTPAGELTVDLRSTLTTMTAVAGMMTVVAVTASRTIVDKIFASARTAPVTAEQAIGLIRTAMIIRLALLEGSSFFGLVILVIAATNGVLFTVSWLAADLLPLLVLVTTAVFTFPTADRLERIFEERFLRAQ